MKHYIIVKFKKEFKYNDYIDDIKSIFSKTLKIDGVSNIKLIKSNSDRENRYDLMIEITMDKSSLCDYDTSMPHRLWKEKYGEYIDKKAIFDCD